MHEYGITIIPVVGDQNRGHFVDPSQHADSAIDGTEPTLYTNYLKFGMRHDLLGLSFADQWLKAGVMDHTDRIGQDFYLRSVLMVAKGEENVVVHCGYTMKFNRPGDSLSESLLTCKDASFALPSNVAGEETAECVIDFHGFLHHEKGQLRVSFDMKEGGDVFTPIGFGIAGTRTNSNRRL